MNRDIKNKYLLNNNSTAGASVVTATTKSTLSTARKRRTPSANPLPKKQRVIFDESEDEDLAVTLARQRAKKEKRYPHTMHYTKRKAMGIQHPLSNNEDEGKSFSTTITIAIANLHRA